MKKGFTLIELLAVIAILGIVSLIAIPAIDRSVNEGKDKLLETQKRQIIKGAKDYLTQNTNELPTDEENTELTVKMLQDNGFLQLNILNPKSDDYVPPTAVVIVEKMGNSYKYTVDESTLFNSSSTSTEGTVIIFNGGPIQYVELGSTFDDKGYQLLDGNGIELSHENVMEIIYNPNGTITQAVNTSELGVYTVNYMYEGSTFKKTVIVVDTQKPTITIKPPVTNNILNLLANQVPGYNFENLVISGDNSGSVALTVNSNVSQVNGNYFIDYIAKDLSGNQTKKRITVMVTGGISFNIPDKEHYTDTKNVEIVFPTTNYQKQYSLDYGGTWETVSNSSVVITLNGPTKIIARVYDGEQVVLSGTVTVLKFNN